MAGDPTAADLLAKAQRALDAARVLLDLSNMDGACNRAYFAMHDAARAALIAVNLDGPTRVIETHRGLIAAFGRLVKQEHLDPDLGQAFNRVEDIRMFADYSGEIPPIEDARWAVEQAEVFVEAIRKRFSP